MNIRGRRVDYCPVYQLRCAFRPEITLASVCGTYDILNDCVI